MNKNRKCSEEHACKYRMRIKMQRKQNKTKAIKTTVEDHYLYLAPHCKLNTKYCHAVSIMINKSQFGSDGNSGFLFLHTKKK